MKVCNTPSPSWKFCLMPSHLKKKPNSRRVWLPTGPGYQLCASFGLGLRAWLSCSLLGLARDIFFQYMQLRRQEIIGPQGWFLWFIVVIRKEMLQKNIMVFSNVLGQIRWTPAEGVASNHGITGVLSIFWSLWTSAFTVKRTHEKMFQDLNRLFLQKQKTQWSIISILEYPSPYLVTSSLRFILEIFSNPHVETRNSIPYQVRKKIETDTSKMEFRALKYNPVQTSHFIILSIVHHDLEEKLLMEEILHQLLGTISYGFLYIFIYIYTSQVVFLGCFPSTVPLVFPDWKCPHSSKGVQRFDWSWSDPHPNSHWWWWKRSGSRTRWLLCFFLSCFTDSTMVNHQKKVNYPKTKKDRLWNMLNFQAP